MGNVNFVGGLRPTVKKYICVNIGTNRYDFMFYFYILSEVIGIYIQVRDKMQINIQQRRFEYDTQ